MSRKKGWVCQQSARRHEATQIGQIRPGGRLLVLVHLARLGCVHCGGKSRGRVDQVRGVGQGAEGKDVAADENGDIAAVLFRQDLEGLDADGRPGRRAARARVDGQPVDVAILSVTQHRGDKVHGAAEVLVHADLDADAAAARVVDGGLAVHGPAVAPQPRPRLDDHVADQLAALHEGGAERLGAGPRLRAPAVEVHAAGVGHGEARGARQLQRRVGPELHNGVRLPGTAGRHGQVAVPGKLVPVELLGQDHGRPAQVGAIVLDGLAKGKL